MSFLAFEPESSGASESSPLRPTIESESERGLDRSLLEKVLNETLAGSHPIRGSSATLNRAGLEAMRDVVKKHRGQPFVLDPVAVELVSAMLRLSLPQTSSTSRELRTMSTQIARSMLDDPVAKDRLKAFWDRLSEMER